MVVSHARQQSLRSFTFYTNGIIIIIIIIICLINHIAVDCTELHDYK